jgi:hypothetical protein
MAAGADDSAVGQGFWAAWCGAAAGRCGRKGFRRLDVLPEQTRRLLLIAAADPLGDAGLVWRAAARLGIDAEAAGDARA